MWGKRSNTTAASAANSTVPKSYRLHTKRILLCKLGISNKTQHSCINTDNIYCRFVNIVFTFFITSVLDGFIAPSRSPI